MHPFVLLIFVGCIVFITVGSIALTGILFILGLGGPFGLLGRHMVGASWVIQPALIPLYLNTGHIFHYWAEPTTTVYVICYTVWAIAFAILLAHDHATHG